MIHVCFGLHDATGRYSKFTGTAMLSLFENLLIPPQSTTVHILHDNTLTNDNREKFCYLARQYNQLVRFYNVEELCADKIEDFKNFMPLVKTSHLSIGAMYRLLIPQILPSDIHKAVYLDSDIVVNLDITKLWQIELGDKILAAADELTLDSFAHPHNNATLNYLVTGGFVDYNDYFNSGVLLMNLDYMRDEEETLMQGVKFVGEHPQLLYLDQEVLNYLYSKIYLKLPAKFNFLVRESRRRSEKINRKIYHFAGVELKSDLNDPFNRLWFKYFIKTPWFNENTIANLCNCFQNLHFGLKQSMINISAAMNGKSRAFILFEKNLNILVEKFSVRNDEEILLVHPGFPVKKMVDIMNASRNEKVFFIMLPDFPFKWLTDRGFVKGKDFFDVYDFWTETQDVSLSYQLIKLM